MMLATDFSCPNCGHAIKLTESLAAPLVATTRAEYERRGVRSMDDERAPDLRSGNGPMNEASEENQIAERFDLEYMPTHLDDPEVVARLCAQESCLRKFVFRGLNELKPVWDSPEIAHFNAHDFIRAIDRCNVLGVRIIGIEIFTTGGELLDIEIPEADSNSWCVSFVQKYQERIDLSICATYEVPGRVLNMPPESLKSLDQA